MATLKEIQTLRETKGKEQETLSLINEAVSQAQNDPEMLVTLDWEAALVYQHIVMNEVAKPESNQNQQIISDAKQKMAEHANKAHELIVANDLTDKLPLSHRFLGRVADYSKNFEEAISHYQKALELFPADSHSRLELSAFLAYSMVMIGKVDEGMDLARKTYSDFSNSDLGKSLKEKDYYAWAVWMSGIPPRQLKALQETGAPYDEEEMRFWLEETKNELENPSGKVTWADNKFQYRIDELVKSLGALIVLLILVTARR